MQYSAVQYSKAQRQQHLRRSLFDQLCHVRDFDDTVRMYDFEKIRFKHLVVQQVEVVRDQGVVLKDCRILRGLSKHARK